MENALTVRQRKIDLLMQKKADENFKTVAELSYFERLEAMEELAKEERGSTKNE